MTLLSIIIPCFNEKESLPELINKLEMLNSNINFIIVENGSTDKSNIYLKDIEKKLSKNIKIYYKKENNGYGEGVFEGLNICDKSDFIGWIHGDLQFEYQKLNKLFEELSGIDTENKIFYKGIRKGRSVMERFISWTMGFLASIILKTKLVEINAQPTVFSYSLLEKLHQPPKDFSFDTYVYWQAKKYNYKFLRGEYNFPPRVYGKSKWNFGIKSRLRFSVKLIKYFFKLKKSDL